jgi:hypothetical protein
MAMEPSHFTLTESGRFMPTQYAQSHWGDDHLSGPSIVGLAARVLEHDCGSPDFMAARLTVDLFKAARGAPTTTKVRVLRDGRRIRNAECDVIQDGLVVAHATLVQYRRSAAPPGREWTAPMSFSAPSVDDDGKLSYVGTDEAEWSPRRHSTRTTRANGSITTVSKCLRARRIHRSCALRWPPRQPAS